jgi:DNA-binding Lrp family transcriptional regulator
MPTATIFRTSNIPLVLAARLRFIRFVSSRLRLDIALHDTVVETPQVLGVIKLLKSLVRLVPMKQQKLLRLLKEMLRNAKRSDREIARELGVSQPTVTRTRSRLEKEYIETYTVVPDFAKLGYEILAFTFIKMKAYLSADESGKILKRASDWAHQHPNIVFAADGEGLGKDLVMVSFHKDYSLYSEFMRIFAMDWRDMIGDFSSFLVNVGSRSKIKPFDLKYLAEDL